MSRIWPVEGALWAEGARAQGPESAPVVRKWPHRGREPAPIAAMGEAGFEPA